MQRLNASHNTVGCTNELLSIDHAMTMRLLMSFKRCLARNCSVSSCVLHVDRLSASSKVCRACNEKVFSKSLTTTAVTMFRRGSGSGVPPTELGSDNAAVQSSALQEGHSSTASTVAAVRVQQQARRRGDASAPTLADLRDSTRASTHGASRTRVQQPAAADSTSKAAATADQGNSPSLRSRLMPLAALNPGPTTSTSGMPQLFSVFINPLSSARQGGKPAEQRRAPAHIHSGDESEQHEDSKQPSQQLAHAATGPSASTAGSVAAAGAPEPCPKQHAEPETSRGAADAEQPPTTSYGRSDAKAAGMAGQHTSGLQRTYCFEVQAAGSEPEELIDYNGHDQHHGQAFALDGQSQQLNSSIQQYVYDEVSPMHVKKDSCMMEETQLDTAQCSNKLTS